MEKGHLLLVYPDIADRMVAVYTEMFHWSGLLMKCCQGTRSPREQERIYAQGRSAPGTVVTWAKPLQSFHNFGCATDSCFEGSDPFLEKMPESESKILWDLFSQIVKSHKLVSGAEFTKPDRPHAEETYGLSLQEVQALYKKGKIAAVWEEFDRIRGVPVGQDWEGLRGTLLTL